MSNTSILIYLNSRSISASNNKIHEIGTEHSPLSPVLPILKPPTVLPPLHYKAFKKNFIVFCFKFKNY